MSRAANTPPRPPLAETLSRRALPLIGGLAILALLNAAMLWGLYVEGAVIPFDFVASYHAVPFFWIEAARAGLSSAWVPFQAFGYPLYLNAQSGLHYPGFWWFVLADRSYGHAAAVVFQGLHILLGAVGAGVCARLGGMRWSTALLAAVAYQAFGAFYSNASHPDIVRAHALAPWVLTPALALWDRRLAFDLSVLTLPVWAYLLWTGGYAGAVVAVFATTAAVVLVRLVAEPGPARRAGLWILPALLVGTLLAGLFLLPAALDRGEVVRAAEGVRPAAEYLQQRDLLALVLRVDDSGWFGHDVTMRSLALGLPVVLLAAGRACLGRWRWAAPALLLLVISLLMASGLAHRPLSALLPPLGYSRFPLSDYRGLLGLGLVLLAGQAWELLPVQSPRRRRAAGAVAAVVLALLVALALTRVYHDARWTTGAPFVFLYAALAALLLYVLASATVDRTRLVVRGGLLAGAIVLITLDWFRVHGNAGYLFGPSAAAVTQQQLQGTLEESRMRLRSVLAQASGCRPARNLVPESAYLETPWRGYYTGTYMSHDYSGPMKFVRHRAILRDPSLTSFGLQPWRAVDVSGSELTPPALLERPVAGGVQCVRYGTDEVHYEVTLGQPTRVVENEVFWPGWSMQIADRQVDAQSVHGFRAWDLPAGHYRVVARFTPPHRTPALLTIAAGFAAWLLLSIFVWRTRYAHEPSSTL